MTTPVQTETLPRTLPRGSGERGSAMIIALMIMIVLTLLGVTFLVLAEQEQQISVNERDLTQALYIAEAGVEVAKTWFNLPDLASNPFKPGNAELTTDLRSGHTTDDPYSNAQERTAPLDDLAGVQYQGGNGLAFEKPYRGELSRQFWGRRDTPDVLVCQVGEQIDLDGDTTDNCSSGANGFMAKLNEALISPPSAEHEVRDLGEVAVQQIRVYRPPIDFDLNARYGIATIEAIAVKKVRGGRIVTQRSVRDVVQEIPFPGPGGAIESESEVGQGGSAGVHWGPVVSAALSDATDNINLPGPNANFPKSGVPRDSPARWGFHHTINPASGHDVGNHAAGSDAYTVLTELIGQSRNAQTKKAYDPIDIDDPWLLFRSRNRISYGGTLMPDQPQPYPFAALTDSTDGSSYKNRTIGNAHSHMWQRQIVRFPPVAYDTWKEVVRSGQSGMNLLIPVGNTNSYRLNGAGTAESFAYWINRLRPGSLGPGVYFFDTTDGIAPHDDNADGLADNLAPSSQFTKVGAIDAYMEGFALLYADEMESKGTGTATPIHANMPGELFLDDGLDLHDGGGTGDGCICIRLDPDTQDCVLGLAPIQWGGTPASQVCGPAAIDCKCSQAQLNIVNAGSEAVRKREVELFRNGVWDSDIDNNGAADGAIDATSPGWGAFVGAADASGLTGHAFGAHRLPHYPANREVDQGRLATDRHRDPRFFTMNAALGGGVRQVHEAFLNFDYPTNGNSIVGWSHGGIFTDFTSDGDVNACAYQADGRLCQTNTGWTTNAREQRGALMELAVNVNGVLYCEGSYEGTGNMAVYGSMMMRGGYGGGGSLEVWFNEELADGLFPPAEWKLPRIYTSARDTD